MVKMCARFVSLFFECFPKTYIFHFYVSKELMNLWWIFMNPLSGIGEIKNHLQYPSNTPKYTTTDPYFIQNNLLLNIQFCMHNNQKILIKYSALFICCSRCPFFMFHRIGIMSLGSTKLGKLSMIRKNRVDFQSQFLSDNLTFKNNF